MSELVRARRYAAAAGLLAALFVGAAYVVKPVPDTLVRWLGGPDGGIDRIGGARVRYRPAHANDSGSLIDRVPLSSTITRDGDVLVIDLVGVEPDQITGLQDVIVGGGVVLREARETDFAERVGPSFGVELDTDAWREVVNGPHRVAYLRAASRETLDYAIAEARARGVTPRDGGEILFEYVEGRDRTQPPYWRTYELAPDVAIDGSLIERAYADYDPYTHQPIVLLDFTREGADRFCEVTRAVVGRKLATVLGDRIRSAPIINQQICGGRASIAMGGTDPRRMEREAAALVAVLSQGALPRGGTVEDIRYQPPADVSTQEWLGRVLLGLVAGLVVGLVVYLVLRYARPQRRSAPVRADGAFPWRRLAVTLLAPLALRLGEELTLPGFNEIEWQHVMSLGGGDSRTLSVSVIALGIMPIVTSFVVVELVALAVPRLRWRRHDPAGRRALGKAVAITSVALALVQGYFAARYLDSLGRGGLELVATPGSRFVIVAMISMATGTLLLAVIAGLIREHGLGNGYGALFASAMVIAIVHWLFADTPADGELMRGTSATAGIAVSLIGAVAVAAMTVCVLRWRIRGAEREPALRVPTAGLAPFSELGGLGFAFGLAALFGLGLSFEAMVWLDDIRQLTWLAAVVLVVAVPLWSWLFARPAVLERVALQAGLPRPTRAVWLRATVLTGAVVVLAVVVGSVARRLDPSHAGMLCHPIAIMIATAVVLDMVDDARARRAALAPAAVLHQIQYAGVVERVLTDAGIPCHIHASHLRTLIAFFAPWAPAIVLVPESLAADARAKLDAVLRASTARMPPAQVVAVSPP